MVDREFRRRTAMAQDNIIQGLRRTVLGFGKGSLALPPAGPVTIILTALTERRSSSLPILMDLMPGTRLRLLNPILSNGDMLEVDRTMKPAARGMLISTGITKQPKFHNLPPEEEK
jgi:hypothetical protein